MRESARCLSLISAWVASFERFKTALFHGVIMMRVGSKTQKKTDTY